MSRPRRAITPELMRTASRMYYTEDKTGLQIADAMKITTRHVAELLKEARHRGFVRISVFGSSATQIEGMIQAKFPHLKKVIVCPGEKISVPDQYPALVKQLAGGAAEFFEELDDYFPPDKPINVAVTGGRQLLGFANAVSPRERHNIHIQTAALLGRGHDQRSTHINPIVTVSVLWARCGYLSGQIDYATVPPFAPAQSGPRARKAARNQLEIAEQNKAIAQIVRDMDKIDVVFTSIGLINPDMVPSNLRGQVVSYSLLESVVTPKQLEAEGAVGSIGYCFFDRDGNGRDEWRFWLTPGHFSERYWGVEFYKRMVAREKLVVVFPNMFDIPGLMTALRAKMFNVLVIDEHSAKQVLEAE